MATQAEKKWMGAICRLGCIACIVSVGIFRTPAVPHHMLDEGGRRIGHLFTIPLCDPGHHQNPQPGSGKIARHPTKTQFEAAYGTEAALLERTRELVGAMA